MKLNPQALLQTLFGPLDHLAAVADQNAILTQEIHNVVTLDLKRAANNTVSELKKHTGLLGEIKDLLKEQNRQLETGSAGKGSAPSSTGFKPMSAKDTGLTAVMIIGIAAALVGAAAIFTFIPVISYDKLLTALAVAAIMLLISPVFVMIANILGKNQGIISMSYGGIGASKPDAGNLFQLMGVSLLAMVGISVALVLSGAILTMMPVISNDKFLTALAVAVIMVPASVAFLMFAKAINKSGIGFKDLAMVSLAYMVVAVGILGTAKLFQFLPDTYKAPDPIWALKSGFAILLFSASFYLIMKAVKGASLKELAFGALAIAAIAAGIVGLAYVFQALPDEGSYKSAPFIWAVTSALTVLAFAFSFYLVMKAVRGASLKELFFGSLAIPLIAAAVMGLAWVFTALPDEFKAPDVMWSLKAGLAIFVFAIPFALVAFVFSKAGLGLKDILMGIIGVLGVAVGILAVAWIFSYLPGTFLAPDLDWAINAALAISIFAVPIGVIGAIIALSGGTGALALLAGVIGIILIAGGIWAVAWIFSKIDTGFASGMEVLTKGLMTPLNGMIDVLKRFKDEIGIENMGALAGGIIMLSGAWITLTGALAGQAVGGLFSSIANLGSSIIDGISSFFGGGKTKSPIDLLDMILNRADAIKKIADPMKSVAGSFGQIAGYTSGVVSGLSAWGKFIEEKNAEILERSAGASERIADAYTKFAKAANGLNIKAVQASTAMFDSLAKLANPDAQNAMKILTQDLLKAVEQLSKTVVNLEDAVEKQADNQESFGDKVDNLVGGVIKAGENLVNGASTKVDKNTPKTKEELAAEKEKAGKLDPALEKALTLMATALKEINAKLYVDSSKGSPALKVVAQ